MLLLHRKSEDSEMQEIDLQMKSKTDFYTNKISNMCLGEGLHKQFPDNNLQLMVISGAKGSMVRSDKSVTLQENPKVYNVSISVCHVRLISRCKRHQRKRGIYDGNYIKK